MLLVRSLNPEPRRGGVTIRRSPRPGAVNPSILCRDRRRSKVLGPGNRLQRAPCRPIPGSVTGTIVQSLSDDADALTDCPNEKDLQMHAFSGIRAAQAGMVSSICA
jgi:hypothetical protein